MTRGRLKMARERLVVNGIQVHLVRMARGRLKMARERLAVNGKQVHLALEAKKWPARGYFWPAKEIFLACGQKYLRSTGLAYHFVGNAKLAFIR